MIKKLSRIFEILVFGVAYSLSSLKILEHGNLYVKSLRDYQIYYLIVFLLTTVQLIFYIEIWKRNELKSIVFLVLTCYSLSIIIKTSVIIETENLILFGFYVHFISLIIFLLYFIVSKLYVKWFRLK